MDGELYRQMLETHVNPAIKELYPSQTHRSGRRDWKKVVFQDDGAAIHRSHATRATVRKHFPHRISAKVQAPKMDDLWPSEWPWAVIDQKLQDYEALFCFFHI